MAIRTLLAAAAVAAAAAQGNTNVTIDSTPCANPENCRQLHGIGGLSGGGATSVMLPQQPEPQRSQILDFLFKPNFGANLQILKVEIGGDAQSTDGAESSHMHNPWEENYQRGQEWWLMTEAKARNPDIKLYGLSWAFPQWVTCTPGTLSNCSGNNPQPQPEQLATQITKWVAGAKNTQNLTIDQIGSWNERAQNTTQLKTLRATLDNNGFAHTQIVAPDSNWGIASDILADPELAEAVFGIGAHQPGTQSSAQAEQTGKPLWASEDDSTQNNAVGAECLARIINQNFVNGNMTATINWNLIAAQMKGTNWQNAGLMTAHSPWNGGQGAQHADGSFTAGPMIWVSAHTTQFTQPGWTQLPIGSGSGKLAVGGSYVTLVDPATGDFSIVVEKMSAEHSSCVRPGLGYFPSAPETVTFQLAPSMAGKVTSLNLWQTHFAFYANDKTVEFQSMPAVPVAADGTFTLNVTVDSLQTLTTIATGSKGSVPTPPAPTLFPAAWTDDFEDCPISSEAPQFADQNGIFECMFSGDATHGIVMQQMIPLRPVTWGGDILPHSLVGHRDTRDASLVIDGQIGEPGASVLLGVHMQGTDDSNGIIFSLDTGANKWYIHSSIGAVSNANSAVASGTPSVAVAPGQWHTQRFDINGTTANVWIDGTPVVTNLDASSLTLSGHFAIGTRNQGEQTQYDNVQLYSTFFQCGTSVPAAGMNVSLVECNSEVGLRNLSQWEFLPSLPGAFNGSFALRNQPSLCLAVPPAPTGSPAWLTLKNCDATDTTQFWKWNFGGIAPDGERPSSIVNPASGRCIDQFGQTSEIGNAVDAWSCSGATNQAFWYDYDAGEIGNEWSGVCLGVC